METTDFIMIEGCKVYTYEIACPQRTAKERRALSRVKSLRRKKSTGNAKRAFVNFLMLLLLPFAFLLDLAGKIVVKIFGAPVRLMMRLYGKAPGTAGALSALSCIIIVSAFILML